LVNPSDNTGRVLEQTGQIVEQTMNQSREAMAQYFNFLQTAFASFPMASTALTDKMKTFTEQNIAEAQQFAQNLGQAKNFEDVIRIQTEYMQNQFRAFGEQTKSLAEELTNSAAGIVKNPFRNY